MTTYVGKQVVGFSYYPNGAIMISCDSTLRLCNMQS